MLKVNVFYFAKNNVNIFYFTLDISKLYKVFSFSYYAKIIINK